MRKTDGRTDGRRAWDLVGLPPRQKQFPFHSPLEGALQGEASSNHVLLTSNLRFFNWAATVPGHRSVEHNSQWSLSLTFLVTLYSCVVPLESEREYAPSACDDN